jgi:RNA polymerase primary sigma factor
VAAYNALALHAPDTSGISRIVGSHFIARKPIPVIAAHTIVDSYMAVISQTPLLSTEAEKKLARRVATGDRAARERMTLANLRLVVRIARSYTGRGLTLEDLVAEGNVGLLRAVEGFDPELGPRFCTYATYWVKQSIRRLLSRTGHAVRLPYYMSSLLAKWRRVEDQLRDKLGREANQAEVIAHLGLSARQAGAVASSQKAIAVGQSSWVGGNDEEDSTTALLADTRSAAPFERLAAEDDLRKIRESLNGLGTRKATILRQRFGLSGEEPATLVEIGKRLGLTRERVRQIEQAALAEIRDRLEGYGLRSSPHAVQHVGKM